MMDGYLDGRKPDNPEPSKNRSASYRQGFANGRDDYARSPRGTAASLRILAATAVKEDFETVVGKSTMGTSVEDLVALLFPRHPSPNRGT